MESQLNQNQTLLFEIAKLYRKYDLGTKVEFINNVKEVRKTNPVIIDQIWEDVILKIRNDEIIKNSKLLSESETEICNDLAQKILNSNPNFKKILYAEFNVKEINLTEENRERRVRNLIAKKYSSILLQNYCENFARERNKIKSRFKKYLIAFNLCLVCLGSAILVPRYKGYYKYIQIVKEWRVKEINNSPRVWYTRTGSKYHNCYHYKNKNSETSLYEAVTSRRLNPCETCNPPIREFKEKPKYRYQNPYLLSLVPLSIAIIGSVIIINKREQKLEL